MIRRPPRSTRTDTLFPYTPRFRSPVAVGGRVITVRFNADVDPALPWAFQPVEREMTLRVGESGLAFFRAENLSAHPTARSEEHTSELQSLMRISYAVFCLKKKKTKNQTRLISLTKYNKHQYQ